MKYYLVVSDWVVLAIFVPCILCKVQIIIIMAQVYVNFGEKPKWHGHLEYWAKLFVVLWFTSSIGLVLIKSLQITHLVVWDYQDLQCFLFT